jgi:sec-independent protein translocase protein TatB
MFDVGGSELLVIGIIALVVIGPKELPGLLRTVGNAMGKVRRMASEFRGQFDEAMREAELDQAKKAFTDMNDVAQSARPTFNPLDTIRNEIQSVKDEMKGVKDTATAPAPAANAAPAATTAATTAPAAATEAKPATIAVQPPPPPPPVDLAPPSPAVMADAPAKPKRSRKKPDGVGVSS